MKTPNTTNTVGSVEETRKRILGELDPDFKTYTPDQGMPDTVWELNDSQIDYIIQQAKAEEKDRACHNYVIAEDVYEFQEMMDNQDTNQT